MKPSRYAILLGLVAGAVQAEPLVTGIVYDAQYQPLPGATVTAGTLTFFMGWGINPVGTAVSNADGSYQIENSAQVPAGTALIVIAKAPGRSSGIYPTQHCLVADQCFVSPSTPTVAAPASNIAFSLPLTASISGTATRTDTGLPVSNTSVFLRSSGGAQVDVRTDSSGHFTRNGLYPTSYIAFSNDPIQPLLPQGYPQHDVDGTIANVDAISVAEPFAAPEGVNVTGIDFHFNPGATISGTLRSAIDQAPVSASVYVRRLTPTESPFEGYSASGSGTYVSQPLLPGTFLVNFSSLTRYVPNYFDNVTDEASATIITLGAGEQRSGINAGLTPRRSLSGLITDAITHQPLPNVKVHLGKVEFAGSLFERAVATTGTDGRYLLQGFDASADLLLWTEQVGPYIDVYYPNVPCCNPMTGASHITVGDADLVSGIDFALGTGAFASGRVLDADTGAGDASAQLYLYSPAHSSPDRQADGAGHYVTAAVSPGNYYLIARTKVGMFAYPNVPCPSSCDLSAATSLSLTAPIEYGNLDFHLPHIDLLFRDGFD